ncbi:MAG TPA: hypothetical protein DCX06_08445 [Opitutae bacterium]|nr:hypothetical protein [Opitutae bacterium]
MNTTLWNALATFSFDEEGDEFTFKARLARENGWTEFFTERAIEEYRRYVYLCCEAGHPCAPSDVVDQVWHLHLCYTRSYWIRLCNETLGQKIHHGPTRGGRDETEKFTDWYTQTLSSYLVVFGETPAHDLWPTIEVYLQKKSFQRVDTSKNLVLSKSRLVAAVTAITLSLGLAGCGMIAVASSTIPFGVIFVGVLLIVAICILIKKNKKGGPGGPGGCGGSCGSDSGCGGCGGD